MKRWIMGAALLCIATGANGAGWIKLGHSADYTEILWVMPARVAGEVWEKLVYSSPQEVDGLVYNKEISLYKINCSQDSELPIQGSFYLDGKAVSAGAMGIHHFMALRGRQLLR